MTGSKKRRTDGLACKDREHGGQIDKRMDGITLVGQNVTDGRTDGRSIKIVTHGHTDTKGKLLSKVGCEIPEKKTNIYK